MKLIKKILIGFLIFFGLFLMFAIWYKYQYSMDEAVSREVNSISLNKKLLIATQGSNFKNKLTDEIVEYYKTDSTYIKIMDISSLGTTNLDDYDAILIMHTWEYSKPPSPIQSFMNSGKYNSKKMVVFTTSGEGSYKMENVDAITGASKLENIGSHKNEIVNKLNPIIHRNN
ncbi:flavodoxin [Saonia flava]|uniref:Flavodoxin n=1 Tax=Saonia flava TaxID=523696 RepID=A0A846QZ37_9FLAO|nr:hypothetical protein [Saonia flava]NJB72190.1 flavodoxin [Saonia flava]